MFNEKQTNRFVPWIHDCFLYLSWIFKKKHSVPNLHGPNSFQKCHFWEATIVRIETFLGDPSLNWKHIATKFRIITPFGNKSFTCFKRKKYVKKRVKLHFSHKKPRKKTSQNMFCPSVMQHSLGIATTTQGYDVVRFHLDNQVQVNESSSRWLTPFGTGATYHLNE